MRWLTLSGVAFVVCFGIAVALYGSGAGSDPHGVAVFYATSGDRLRQIGGFAALLVGCGFLLVYVVVLARDVIRVEPLSTIAVLSGGGAALMLAAANALWAASAFTAEMEQGYRMSASTHLLVEDAGFVVVVTAMALAIPFVSAVSLAVWRSRLLPAWFCALGVVCVGGLAGAYWYWPIATFLAWVACGSALLARQQADPSADVGAAELASR